MRNSPGSESVSASLLSTGQLPPAATRWHRLRDSSSPPPPSQRRALGAPPCWRSGAASFACRSPVAPPSADAVESGCLGTLLHRASRPVERTQNVSYSKKDPVEAEAEGTLLM